MTAAVLGLMAGWAVLLVQGGPEVAVAVAELTRRRPGAGGAQVARCDLLGPVPPDPRSFVRVAAGSPTDPSTLAATA